MNLPPLNKEPLHYIDSTPDNKYPIRILQAHLENTKCRFVLTEPAEQSKLYDMMNYQQNKRAEILQQAINILEESLLNESSATDA